MICDNCRADVETLHCVGGYSACQDCADQADLPYQLRGNL